MIIHLSMCHIVLLSCYPYSYHDYKVMYWNKNLIIERGNNMSTEKQKIRLLDKIDKPTLLLPAIILIAAVVFGAVAPDAFNSASTAAFNFTTKYFGWFYAFGVSLLMLFCVWAGFSKYGKIKLGGKDAKPEMSFVTWFYICLTSGIAIGIIYWGVAEPLYDLITPPGFTGWEPSSAEAAEGALKFAFLHWGFHPYAIYTAAGLCCAFIILNGKRRFSISSSLYPLLGDRTEGTIGKLVNGLCIFAIVGGMGTSLGYGVSQFCVGVNYVFGTNIPDSSIAVFFIGIVVILSIAFSCSGLQRGIKYVSTLKMYVFYAMLIWAFIFGGTLFILNNTTSAIGQYLAFIVPESFYLEPVKATGWINGWSIFYWAWWLAFAPIVGLFQIKLAKGRTVRQFVIVNLIAPTLFAIVWFGVFGSSAINLELNGANIAAKLSEWGSSVAMFAYFDNLPLKTLFHGILFVAIVISILALSESMTLTLADMSTKPQYLGESDKPQDSPRSLKVFWALLVGAIAFILLFSGGLGALQTAAIVCGFPILMLQLLMAVAYIKSMRQQSKYDLTLTEKEKAEMEQGEGKEKETIETEGQLE